MVSIKTDREIRIMKEGGHILAAILKKIQNAVSPGTTTLELDSLATDLCSKYKVKPAFLGYHGYPAVLCASVNNVIVHGIPNNTPLRCGDILGIDMGIKHKGYYTDAAISVSVGSANRDVSRLLHATKEALSAGILAAKAGAHIGDVGAAIAEVALKYKLGIVRELSGHGIGHELQEDPAVPNFGQKGTGLALKRGMTIAIEPMFSLGKPQTKVLKDNWSVGIADGSIGTHFEHTVLVEERFGIVLTR